MDFQIFKERMGQKITPQRIVVYRIVTELKLYVSASTIYHELRVTFPSLSRATVYKVLKHLTKRGLLRMRRNADGVMYYAAAGDGQSMKILTHKNAAAQMIKSKERRRLFFSEKQRNEKAAELLRVTRNK